MVYQLKRLRFSLRSFILALAALSAFLGYRLELGRRHSWAVSVLQKHGAEIEYEYQTLDASAFLKSNPGAHIYAGKEPNFHAVDKTIPHPVPSGLRSIAEALFPQRISSVRLYWTKSSPELVRAISSLSSIKRLHLRRTSLDDTELLAMANLRNVCALDIGETLVTDVGLAAICAWSNLRILKIDNTRVGDDGLKNLKDLKLEELFIGDTLVTDDGMKSIAAIETLRTLDVHQTAISDESMKFLIELSRIDSLNLMFTKVTDGAIPTVSSLVSLRQVFLNGTQISPAGAAELKKFLPKTAIAHYSLQKSVLTYTF